MIELSGLRRYETNRGVARLEADIKFVDMDIVAPADTMYFEIDADYAAMLVNDTYDPFMITALLLAMYNKTELRIRGNVSKKLYKNLTWYAQKILCDFSDKLAPVKITVDGFAPVNVTGTLIGTGMSCGVDSLSTVYDRYICEDDPDYKINALFFFNCGSNGVGEEFFIENLAQSRCQRVMQVAGELGLPLVPLDTNLHEFDSKEKYGDTFFYLATYACILAMQNVILRYYMSSGCSYYEIKSTAVHYKNYAVAGYCESFFVPLIQTERMEIIIDGCQYKRVDKLKQIVDWEITRKYLNVCNIYSKDSHNCGSCKKCLRTLLSLEIMGKLDKFAHLFDMNSYRANVLNFMARCVAEVDNSVFYKEILDLAEEYNFPMPTRRDCYTLGRQVVIFENEE